MGRNGSDAVGDDAHDVALAVLGELVAIETVTATSNLELIDLAEVHLREVGATCRRTYDAGRGKANLFATIGPETDGGVVLSGHTDVVPADEEGWTTAPFELDVRGGRAFGRGTCDMKGFIACVLAMAPRFAAAGLERPVHVALTFDEEVGCQGAPLLLADLADRGPRPVAAIVGEPTRLRIVTGHKGCYEYTTTITGREGHGSTPARSVNAVEYAARYISRLRGIAAELETRAPADSPFDPPASTVSVGAIRGGTARNIVAGTCSFDWEFRPIGPEDAAYTASEVAELEAELIAAMRATDPEAGIVTTTAGEVGGLSVRDDDPVVELTRRLLGDAELDVVSYNTEAGLFQQAGIPAVVCGPGSIDVAHRPDEHLELADLDRCLAMLDRLADELSVSSAL